MDTYSVPLAVMISIFLLDFVGSHPMLNAASLGMLVMLAPVSKAMVRKTGLPFLPAMDTLTGIKLGLGWRGYSAIKGKSGRVAFRKVVPRIADKDRVFGVVLGYFLVYDRSIGVVVKKRTSNWLGFLHLFNPNQQPFVLEPLFNIHDFLNLHSSHLRLNNTLSLERIQAGRFSLEYEPASSSPVDKKPAQTSFPPLSSQEMAALAPFYNSAQEFFSTFSQWAEEHPGWKLLVIVRHGESASNLFKFAQTYKSYSPLTWRGLKQAREMARFFAMSGIDFDRYITSDLERAYETMRLLAVQQGNKPEVLKRFREALIVPFLEGLPRFVENPEEFTISGYSGRKVNPYFR